MNLTQRLIKCFIVLSIFGFSSAMAATPKKSCTDASRECVQSAANAYLQGLLKHDASDIPLADEAKRWENGINTAPNAVAIRNSINNDLGMKSIKDIRDIRWLVDGNQAIAFYLLDADLPYTTLHASTTRIAERFLVEDGLIKEIEVIFCNSPGVKPESREIDARTPLSFMCSRLL